MRAILAILLFASPAAAQTRHDEQLWLNATIMGRIGEHADYFVEVQPRFGEGVSRVNQRILRGALGWRLNRNFALSQGFGVITNPIDGARNQVEHRSFQQAMWIIGRPFGGELSSRTRLEQRWRNDGDDLAWRVTQVMRMKLPLSDRPRSMAALLRAEGYFALNDADWGVAAGLDQVRGFAGVEIPMAGRSTLELGYLNQTINLPAGRARMNHAASVAIIIRP